MRHLLLGLAQLWESCDTVLAAAPQQNRGIFVDSVRVCRSAVKERWNEEYGATGVEMPEDIGFSQSSSVFSIVQNSGPVVQAVLLILIVISIWSWTITIAKYLQYRRARAESEEFSSIFWETKNFSRIDDSVRRLDASPLVQLFSAGYRELRNIIDPEDGKKSEMTSDLSSVEGALKRTELEESHRLEKGITFLATTASAAPFIGLFGTVWGIMNAFHGLGLQKSSTIQAVAPGISEALVATAVGLAAAIPAAVAYNYFAVALRQFRESMDRFNSEFLTIASRYIARV